MSDFNLFPEWRKKASMIASRNSDKDQQEQAFLNLAYGAVSQKAGKLMEDPHRLGFEIIYSNDDNSKMAGMFAFRIGRSLLSVPVIFINNDIKGTELMYEHDTKLVRPLSVDWADYMVSKYQQQEASFEDPTVTNRITSGMYLDRIAGNGMRKRASADEAWEAVFEDLEKKKDVEGNILTEFLLDAGQSGMEKLAHAIEMSLPFAEALTSLDESIWLPDFPIEKEASEKTPDLEFYFKYFPFTKMSAEENEDAHKRGFFLWENRPDSDLNPVVRETQELISEVNTPGLYNVVTSQGEMKEAWVLNKYDKYYHCSPCDSSNAPISAFSGSKEKLIIWKEDKSECTKSGEVWGEFAQNDEGQLWRWEAADLPEKPTVGKTYYAVVDNGGYVYGPHKVTSVRERQDGITVVEALEEYSETPEVHYINPDVAHVTHQDGCGEIFPPTVRWLEVATEKKDYGSGYRIKRSKTRAGNQENVFHALNRVGVKKLTVKKEEDSPNFKVIYADEPKFDGIDAPNAAVKVASDLRISASDALWLVDEARRKDGREVSVLVLENELIKSASQMMPTSMSIIGAPQYQYGHNSELNVREEMPQEWALESSTVQPYHPPMRYGDAYDPSMGISVGNQDNSPKYLSEEAMKLGMTDDMLFDSSPEEIAQLYTESNIPNLFQHGTVGMLVSTYDSANMIAKYIPKLEEGLDHFGRILFLFYWKPQDFEKLYGADDLANLEQEILSQFKSFGDVLLELIKKNEIHTGTVPTP